MDNKDYKKKYEQSQEAFDKFLYLFTHDFKAHIRNLNSLSQWIVEDIQEENYDDIKENASMLDETVRHLNIIMNRLYDYSKIKLELYDCQLVNLNDLVNTIKSSYASDVQIELNELPTIEVPEKLLFWLFKDLINNSIVFQKPNIPPVISISSQKINEAFHFVYKDNSIGIPPEMFNKAFEMMTNFHGDRTKKTSGMGLAIVQKIIEEFGGQIEFKPVDQGVHIEFSIIL